MKKFFAIICVSALALCASAQVNKGQAAAGINLLYGSEIKSMGLGARFNYAFIDQLRGQVEFDGYFKRHNTTWFDVSINAEYLVPIKTDVLYVYPKAGMTYSMKTIKDPVTKEKDEENHVGLNLGAGLEYEINDHFAATLEYRHTIIRRVDQGSFALGVNYKF